MNVRSLETWNTRFRKKVKAVSALATIAGDVLFRPVRGTQYVLESAYVKIRTVVGTVTDAPNITMTGYTPGASPPHTVVGAVDLGTTPGLIQRLAVIGNVYIDNDHPLILTSADAQNGGTVFDYDIILFLDKVSD